jgi:hypothetical protein
VIVYHPPPSNNSTIPVNTNDPTPSTPLSLPPAELPREKETEKKNGVEFYRKHHVSVRNRHREIIPSTTTLSKENACHALEI